MQQFEACSLPDHRVTWQQRSDNVGPPAVGIAKTPLGRVRVVLYGSVIVAFDLLDHGRECGPLPDSFEEDDQAAQMVMTSVFGEEPAVFEVAPEGTAFQQAVWRELLRIPYGSTITYGEVARRLGRTPSAARAVGGAVGSNPIAILIPCHRVMGAANKLTGFGWGLERKEWMLRAEGALLI
ncbi:methylated-DNA--[protein]-cysteine S-methyltransferase [Mucisphaera sp.]|uniref:methylated-DNA--[protein]-cysteine S-methyltransferase n=1 Tax=Mucisphaera sp. TaxID=2913024 RepID=UPI003D0F6364